MIKILVVNPVGHSKWDEQDKAIYRSFASNSTSIDVVSLPQGPPTVETIESYREAEKGVIRLVKRIHKSYDAVIVNCFLDPGVARLKRIIKKPVIGPCEASISFARSLGRNIVVVTVGAAIDTGALKLMERRIRLYAGRARASLRTIPLGVMDLDVDRGKTLELLLKEVTEATKIGAEVVVLGCTGLAGFASHIAKTVRVPVIDPAQAALKYAESLVTLIRSSSNEKE